MANNSSGVYTFYPTFSDFIPLYRGANGVWIGDGTEIDVEHKKGGTAGALYVSYITDEYQELGFVSDYNVMKEYFEQLGIELTYEEYARLLANMPANARMSEAWARGTEDDVDVPSTHPAYHDNSLYWKDQSKLWANFGSDGDTPSSDNNAKEYARLAGVSKTGAETAQTKAEEAQAKAEEAMSHYPRINNNDNWETWNVEHEDWQDTGHKSIAEATIEYAYQNSNYGTIVPTGTWTPNPDPQNGKFLWVRMQYTWTNGRIDDFYNVTYIGVNGTGAVNSVNGLGGDVILDGKNIYVDNESLPKETIYNAFARLGTRITDSEIDALF